MNARLLHRRKPAAQDTGYVVEFAPIGGHHVEPLKTRAHGAVELADDIHHWVTPHMDNHLHGVDLDLENKRGTVYSAAGTSTFTIQPGQAA